MADTLTQSSSRPAVGHGRIYQSITETIGNTPLVQLNRLAKKKGVEARLLAKLEFFNPIGSVKDRIGVSMIEALEKAGLSYGPIREPIDLLDDPHLKAGGALMKTKEPGGGMEIAGAALPLEFDGLTADD